MVEKVDYSKHANLVYPLSELGMSVCRVDVGSLKKSNNNKHNNENR